MGSWEIRHWFGHRLSLQTFLCGFATQPEEFQLLEEFLMGFNIQRNTGNGGGWAGTARVDKQC